MPRSILAPGGRRTRYRPAGCGSLPCVWDPTRSRPTSRWAPATLPAQSGWVAPSRAPPGPMQPSHQARSTMTRTISAFFRAGEPAHRPTGCGLLPRTWDPSRSRAAPRRAPAPLLARPGNRSNRHWAAELARDHSDHRRDAAQPGPALSPVWDKPSPPDPAKKLQPPVQLTGTSNSPKRAAFFPHPLSSRPPAPGRPRPTQPHPVTTYSCSAEPPSTCRATGSLSI